MIENKERLAKNRKKNAVSRSHESLLARNERLSQMRNYIRSQLLSQESQNERINQLNRIHERSVCKSTEERQHLLDAIRNRLTNDTPEQRQRRLDVINERIRTELPSRCTQTPAAVRERNYKMLSVENEEQRQNRLANMRETQRRNRFLGKDEFYICH
ncbi:hypothetical protein EVAR_6549_1 [Eumeta japonica]|uniref:Uncharacterized protein n=1 Tax=Eumeta variegata TaxID=151549 RepID=A0A4C1SQB4_EUMVA|nr:hypothetical protein EVAR_6549_1 [Eumeta japonica]